MNKKKAIEDVRFEMKLNTRELEVKKRIFLAVSDKEQEMLNKFEKWLNYIEDAFEKEEEN